IATFWFSTKPPSKRPLRNAFTKLTVGSGGAECRKPTTGIVARCARAITGSAKAAPAISLMNSRRFMEALARARDHATRLQNDTLEKGHGVGLAVTSRKR